MDRRIFDMLELYKQNNTEVKPNPEACVNTDFCKDTNYNVPNGEVLTMAFVNMQPIESVYETDEGFCRGTIFPNIDKPLSGVRRYE